MCTKKSECELKTWRRKCIIQSESKSKICLLNLHNRAVDFVEAEFAADRIARRGCKIPLAIRIPIVIEGESEQSYLLMGFGAKAVALFIGNIQF